MHLFSLGAGKVSIHPDGEHGKRFEIQAWLVMHGFVWGREWGTSSYVGQYSNGGRILEVNVKPGHVVAVIEGRPVIAERKGSIVTIHDTPDRSLVCGKGCTRQPDSF